MDGLRKIGTPVIVIFVMILIFSYAANLEYRHSVKQDQDSLKENLLNIQTKIENMISSRVINANGMAGFIEINKGFDKNAFDIFAREIYRSETNIIKDVVFIEDTTIVYIYPVQLSGDALGIDLASIPAQKDLLLYTKEFNKTVFFGPVDLVEGGQGIIVRVPVYVNELYYGQVAIVYDYDAFIEESGLKDLSKDHNVVLKGNNPLNEEPVVIWQSSLDKKDDYVYTKIRLHDIEWMITAKPIDGWDGFSQLFYLIIVTGMIVIIGASSAYYKEGALEKELKAINMDLHKTIDQLELNKRELYEKYNVIKEKESYIQHLADHDVLTGLYNRRLFREHLEKSLQSGNDGLVILIDIDNFKYVNDMHGHIYGDQLLKESSLAISKTVGTLGKCYRFGGDEFLIHINKPYTDDEVRKFAIKIAKEFKNTVSGVSMTPVTLSAGAVRYPSQGSDVETLLIYADLAMYESKKAGKNKITIFEQPLLDVMNKKIAIENHIRNEIKSEGFEMYYQPIVDAKTLEIQSFEALIRLKDRLYSPYELIEVAESSGFIIELGKWILREVLTQLSIWVKDGSMEKPVAINISPKQLMATTFSKDLLDLIHALNVPIEMIELEITESVLLEKETENIRILTELRDAGIKISMDDFGTGYSSLRYLTYMPIDKVKIDKSLKDQLIQMDNSETLSGIVQTVHGLNLEVVAEGIEDLREVEILKSIGFDQLQGYLFSRPVPASQVLRVLADK